MAIHLPVIAMRGHRGMLQLSTVPLPLSLSTFRTPQRSAHLLPTIVATSCERGLRQKSTLSPQHHTATDRFTQEAPIVFRNTAGGENSNKPGVLFPTPSVQPLTRQTTETEGRNSKPVLVSRVSRGATPWKSSGGDGEAAQPVQENIDRYLLPISPDKDEDLNFLVEHFTAPALAAALHDRNMTLKLCAEYMSEGKFKELEMLLKPWRTHQLNPANKVRRAESEAPSASETLDESYLLSPEHLQVMKYRLNRMPRKVANAAEHRASVLIPLCLRNGEPCIFLTKRSNKVSKHKSEVCFPGGMVDEEQDSFIIETCLRETQEETGIPAKLVQVLGILRCDWSKISSLTGIAVTPIVGFMGEIQDIQVAINEDEVAEWFTIPLKDLMRKEHWIIKDRSAPVFTGGKEMVWGLTAYILQIFLKEIAVPSSTKLGRKAKVATALSKVDESLS